MCIQERSSDRLEPPAARLRCFALRRYPGCEWWWPFLKPTPQECPREPKLTSPCPLFPVAPLAARLPASHIPLTSKLALCRSNWRLQTQKETSHPVRFPMFFGRCVGLIRRFSFQRPRWPTRSNEYLSSAFATENQNGLM